MARMLIKIHAALLEIPLFIFVHLTASFMFFSTSWTYDQLESPSASAEGHGHVVRHRAGQKGPADREDPTCRQGLRTMVAIASGQAHCGTAAAHLHLSTCTIKSRSVHSFLTCSRLATVVTGTYWSLSICDIRYMSLARFSLQREDNLSWNLVRAEGQDSAPGLRPHAHPTCRLPPLWI